MTYVKQTTQRLRRRSEQSISDLRYFGLLIWIFCPLAFLGTLVEALFKVLYQVPFAFTGKIDKLTIALDEPKLTPDDVQKLEAAYRAAQDAN